jgi:hypothetical protein
LVGRRQSIEPSSTGAVQKFNDSFELLEPLPQKALDILGVLGSDGVADEAVRVTVAAKATSLIGKTSS